MKQKQDWHIEDVKAALRKRGLSFASIARDMSVSRAAVTNVAKGIRSKKIEAAIAAALKKEPKEIWPSRYLGE